MNIVDHFSNSIETVVVTLNDGLIGVAAYHKGEEGDGNVLLAEPTDTLLLTAVEAHRLGDALIYAAHHADEEVVETEES